MVELDGIWRRLLSEGNGRRVQDDRASREKGGDLGEAKSGIRESGMLCVHCQSEPGAKILPMWIVC